VAALSGAAAVTASSSGSWLVETPQLDPVNVFDGNPETAWTEANPTSAVGQWVQIRFDRRLVLPGSMMVTLLNDLSSRPVASRLTVSTDAGSITSNVSRTSVAQPLRIPAGATRTLRITIAAARGGVPGGPGAGISGLDIPGVKVTRYLRPAQDPAGSQAPSTVFSFNQTVPSPASLANVAAYPPLARTFESSASGKFTFGATAIAAPGPALDAILASLTPVRRKMIAVTASSTYGSLPSLAPANLFRRHNPGAWIAGGRDASLTLSWRGMRTIRRMVIQPLPGLAAAPESIKITSPHGVRDATVGLGGQTAIVPPLRTNQMTISFPVVQYATSAQPISGQPARLPVGLSSLSIPALSGLRPATPARHASFALPCGSGPSVRLDGRMLRTRVFGSVGSLISFGPVRVRLCRPSTGVWLATGPHRLLAASPKAFTLTGMSLVNAGASGLPGRRQAQDLGSATPGQAATSLGRKVKVLTWGQEYRQVRVGRGAASYLELHQNENAGWTATMHGKTLRPVRLDGWQQGFVMPAGQGGVVTLTFKPVKFYHVWIILSAAGALGLLLTAIAGRRRERARELRGRVREQMDQAVPAAAPTLTWASSPWVVPAPASAPQRVKLAPWLALLGLTVLIAIVGGPVALAVPVVAYLAYRWPSWFGALAAAGMIAAGVLTALATHPSLPGTGAFGAPAQACALVALTCALMPVLPDTLPDALRDVLPDVVSRSWAVRR
jgi:arabinofuranan 3-O-arabinosyltransferase